MNFKNLKILLKSFLNNSKKIDKLDILILIFGLACYFFGYYFITFYMLVHLAVRVLQTVSKTVDNKLKSLKNDQEIIKSHYLKDFKFFYYFTIIIKVITGWFYIYFFFLLNPESIEQYSFVFFTITYTFIITNLIDLGITIYIILEKNDPVKDAAANICYHCIVKGVFTSLGALHMSSNVPMISPNPVTNYYHLWSPLGRGYGAYSSFQLLQVDLMKTQLGSNFDYTQCIDHNKFLDSQKMEIYSEKNGININKMLLDHNHYWFSKK